MSELLNTEEIVGTFTQPEHHAIAAELKAMSDKWDKEEEKTGKRPSEAFDYSFGLVMGRLIFSVNPEKLEVLRQKIDNEISIVRMK